MKNIARVIFLIVLIGDLAGIQLGNELLQYIFKPLIVPAVAMIFLSQVGTQLKNLQLLILGGLFFSWLGDILLMFVPRNDLFFLLGLSSFLVAHIFYILFFHKLKTREGIGSNAWLLVIVAVYYATLIVLLGDKPGEMEWPVRVYGIVISFMMLLALHMTRLSDRRAGRMMMSGAILFVLSDSVLAINKFYQPFEGAGLIIMVTYAFAQLMIAEGAARYLVNTRKD